LLRSLAPTLGKKGFAIVDLNLPHILTVLSHKESKNF